MASLVIKSGTLKAGKYVLIVDPCSSTGSKDHPDFSKLMIDAYSSQVVKLNKVDNKAGMNLVRKCFKRLALSDEYKGNRETFLASNAGMENIFRVNELNMKESGFGILLNKNEGDKTLEMTVKVTYTGGVIVDEDGENRDEVALNIAPGKDHCLILRATENA